MTYDSNIESFGAGLIPTVEADLETQAAMVNEITGADAHYDNSSAMLGAEAVAASDLTGESRLGRMMTTIGESKAARKAAALAFLTAGIGGGALAIESNTGAAAQEAQDLNVTINPRVAMDCTAESAGTAAPTVMQPNSAGENIPLTPVADCYGVYQGVKDYTVGPMDNDILDPNVSIEEILKTEVCGISPSDGSVILEKSFTSNFIDITVVPGATAGLHHSVVTFCNPEKGNSATFDFAVNVDSVSQPVIKKLFVKRDGKRFPLIRHGLYGMSVANTNDADMLFASYNTKIIPPHSRRRLYVTRVARWGASLVEQHAPAGQGKITFRKK